MDLGGFQMHNLNVTEGIQKRIKRGISFALVGTMLVTSATMIKKNKSDIDNGRYHILQQEMTTEKQIEVTQGINLYLNDHVFIPRDVNGNEVTPFIYNGTTYLPIRAITSALGAEVGYANNTAMITRQANAQINPGVEWRKDIEPITTTLNVSTNINIDVDGSSFIPRDANGNLVANFVVNGTTYVPIRALCNEFHIPVVWDGRNNRIYLGSHIELTDPDTYSNEDYQMKQNYTNIALVSIQQHKMDVKTLRKQAEAYQEFINEILATYRIVDGTSYHTEVEELHKSIVEEYSLILKAVQKYTDEYVQKEWDATVDQMNTKDTLGINAYAFISEAYAEMCQTLSELNSYCTDSRLEKLYNQLNNIIEKYQNSLAKTKQLSN